MVSRSALRQHFFNLGVEVADAVLERCEEICMANKVEEEEFVEIWMAYSVSNLKGAEPTLETINQMERKEFSKKERDKPIVSKTPKKGNLIIYNTQVDELNHEDILHSYETTPKAKKLLSCNNSSDQHRSPRSVFSPASFSPSITTPSRKYASRTNSGDAVCVFGAKSNSASWVPSSATFTPQVILVDPIPEAASYMYDHLADKGSILDETIEHIGEQLVAKYNLDIPESLNAVHPEPFITIGRVCCDANGRLNAASVLLEGSRGLCRGAALPLNLEHTPQYSLFPGQVIAVCATNPTREKLITQQVYCSVPCPLPKQLPQLTAEDGPLHIVVASGPFTPSNTMTYEPLEDLVQYLYQHHPHVVILTGPFVDAMHQQVQQGAVAETFLAFFEKLIDGIMAPLKELQTQVVVAASWRDVHHHPVYPTPPFSIRKKYPNLHMAGDPCKLDIRGLIVGVTSADILMHLGKEEISWPAQGADRLGRLASHVLSQQSLYPLYPPPEEMPIDFDMWVQYSRLSVTPHILILPSDLRYFIRELHGCVVVNPEHLAKGMVGGSFARLQVLPPDPSGEWHSKYVSGEIVKI